MLKHIKKERKLFVIKTDQSWCAFVSLMNSASEINLEKRFISDVEISKRDRGYVEANFDVSKQVGSSKKELLLFVRHLLILTEFVECIYMYFVRQA